MLKVEKNSQYDNMTRDELLGTISELNNKIAMNEEFLLNISHDLRSPINVILSIVQFLDNIHRDNNDSKVKEYRDLIKRNCFKIIKLIDNLIDTTKLEGNFYNLNMKNIEVISMIEAIVTSIDEYAEQKKIQLVFDTNIEECVSAVDPQALDRIMMNLLSNAIKFSPIETHIFIDLFVDKKYIKISVRDEGPGIAKEEQNVIFDRFVQSSHNKREEFAGSGIGLDLVNYLTKAHGGTVELKSEEGIGSEFTVKIPIKLIEDEEGDFNLLRKDKVQQLEIEFSDIYL